MAQLPAGTVTFLFTDIEGSTRLLDKLGEEGYEHALSEHRLRLREAFLRHAGVEVDTQGDAFFYAFADASEAVAAAAEAQRALATGPIRVRMGLHTGAARLTQEGYIGREVHRGARIAGAGHGGQVLLSQATATLVDEALTDLGEHRLKDFAAPVWIYQLGAERFPPLRTISNTNLPRLANSFVGRELEVAEVGSLLRNDARLVTLTGPGGTGKTRLAIETAAGLVPDFRNGVFWVDLAPLRDPALVTDTIGQVLGAKDGLADYIQERELLLLLDNLEQVVEAAPQLSALVEACPNLKVLVTSREVLRVRGEVEYRVLPLPEPDGVALFCARAGAQPDATVHELCRALDNLPLALELAAARANILSPIQILERLSVRLDLFKGGRDADPRQQTLRATIAWSFELLREEERRLFARLAVFAGGCTLETAEAIADADLDTLQSLVDKSLVRHSDERFWMLETIREYAAERLEDSGEDEMVQRRHAQYFLALGEEAALQTRFYSGEWIGRLELEHDNLRAALDRLAAAGEDELVLQLAGALKEFWMSGGHVAEGRQRLESALQGQKRPTAARARALTGAAAIAYSSGDVPAARSLAEQGLELHRRLDDPRGAAQSLHVLSLAAIEDGAFERGQRLVEEALALYRQAGDERDTVAATRMLAFAYVSSGDLERGRALHESNLAQAQALGFKEAEAGTLGSLAMLAFHEGRLEDAAALRKQNLLAACELGSLQAIAQSLCRNASACAQIVGKAGVAARLLSFFEAQRPQIGVSESWIANVNEETLAAIRTRLDESAFTEAWEQGRTLTVDEAVALALESLEEARRGAIP